MIPPQSPEAERAVIGACLLSKDALSSAIELLKPDDFFDNKNKTAFEVLASMFTADKPADYVTFGDELRGRGIFDRLGGQSFVNGLIDDVTTTANTEYHAQIVRERSIRRKLIASCEKIALLAANYDKTLAAILEEAEKLIFDASQNKSSSEFRHVSELIGPVFVSIEERFHETGTHVSGYATGFTDLDAYTGGLQPGSLNIIAARPSMGKTAFALNIAQFGGGEANDHVLIFSLEMPADHLVQRMVAAQSRVDLSKMKRGLLNVGEFDDIAAACDVLAKRNIFINDATQLSALEFRAKCRAFKMRHPDLALVIVDYLQLMTSGEKRSEGRQQEVSDISRMLKTVARELACPVIALSQLSRAAEQRTDKKPQLSDLRDSGAIEQDADLVMMLYREDYYSENENNALKDSRADIRIAKNRNGSTGMFSLTFKREITRFLNFGEV